MEKSVIDKQPAFMADGQVDVSRDEVAEQRVTIVNLISDQPPGLVLGASASGPASPATAPASVRSRSLPLLHQGVIHPKLKLHEAKGLLVKFQGRPNNSTSPRAGVKRRLHQFRDYVLHTLSKWQSEDRALAKTEIARLVELIDASSGDRFEGGRHDSRICHLANLKIFLSRRSAALHSPQQPATTV